MPDFESFVVRHSEVGAQMLIECLERFEGVSPSIEMPLEERWRTVMCLSNTCKAA